MKILLVENKTNHISAVVVALEDIKDNECKEVSTIISTDNINELDKKIKKEKPNILILNGGFLFYLTKERISSLKSLYPEMSILVLTTSFEQEMEFIKLGIDNFILKDFAVDFYKELVNFFNKECKKRNKKNN